MGSPQARSSLPHQGQTWLAAPFAALLLGSCGPDPDTLWTSRLPEPHDQALIASEIQQDARPPLVGLPIRDTLTVQCRKDGRVRMVLDFMQGLPHTNDPQVVWQPTAVWDMPYRIDRAPQEAVTFSYEVFRRSHDPSLSYRYVAEEQTQPQLIQALEAMSRGQSLRRFDTIREPRYALSPKIGEFVVACRRNAPHAPESSSR